MSAHTFKIPTPGQELPVSLLLGTAFALLLFVLMALAQMIGDVTPPDNSIDETLVAFTPPDIAEIEDEPPPPPEEEKPPPELDEPPPELSLAQLDLARRMESRHDGRLALGVRDATHHRLPKLPEVHPHMEADEAEHQIHWRTVGQMGHLIVGQNPTHDRLGAMAVAELVARFEGVRRVEESGG